MNTPFFSILIPYYKGKQYISRALESCFNQVYKNFQIILCDDNSNDGTMDLLQKIKVQNFHYYLSKQRNGKISVRNFLISKARGKYCIFLQPFDLIAPNFLQDAHNELINDDIDILQFSVAWISKDNNMDVTTINSCISINPFNSYMKREDVMQNSFYSKVIKTQVLKKLNIFQDKIFFSDELFYMLQIFYYAKKYKSVQNTYPEYFYYYDIDHYDGQNDANVDNIIQLCKIKNKSLVDNIKFLKSKNLYIDQYRIGLLKKAELFDLLNNMIGVEKKEDRIKVFSQFQKYFYIQIGASILNESNRQVK